MKKHYLLFDLDGTLTDPMVGITKSVQYALRAYGITVKDLNQLCCFIGPPLSESFQKYYGFSETEAKAAIPKFREYFSVQGIYENEVYQGIDDLLSGLKSEGHILMVATSKPEVFARQILDHFRLNSYFNFVGGADLDETRVKKADVIRYVLEENHIKDLTQVVMIGDREHDIWGAKEVGVESIGILYGYGSREELELAGANHIVGTVDALKKLFLTAF